jgi:hypothetical protein
VALTAGGQDKFDLEQTVVGGLDKSTCEIYSLLQRALSELLPSNRTV